MGSGAPGGSFAPQLAGASYDLVPQPLSPMTMNRPSSHPSQHSFNVGLGSYTGSPAGPVTPSVSSVASMSSSSTPIVSNQPVFLGPPLPPPLPHSSQTPQPVIGGGMPAYNLPPPPPGAPGVPGDSGSYAVPFHGPVDYFYPQPQYPHGGHFPRQYSFNVSLPDLSPGFSQGSIVYPRSPMSASTTDQQEGFKPPLVPTQSYPGLNRAPSFHSPVAAVDMSPVPANHISPALLSATRQYPRAVSYDSNVTELEPERRAATAATVTATMPVATPRFEMYNFVGRVDRHPSPSPQESVRGSSFGQGVTPSPAPRPMSQPVAADHFPTSALRSPFEDPPSRQASGSQASHHPYPKPMEILAQSPTFSKKIDRDPKPQAAAYEVSPPTSPELCGVDSEEPSHSPGPSTLPSYPSSPLPVAFRGVQECEPVHYTRRVTLRSSPRKASPDGDYYLQQESDLSEPEPEDVNDGEFVPSSARAAGGRTNSKKRARAVFHTSPRRVVHTSPRPQVGPHSSAATGSAVAAPVPAPMPIIQPPGPPELTLYGLLEIYPDIPKLYPLFYYTLLNDLKLNPAAAPMIGSIPPTYSPLEKGEALRAFFHRGRRMLAQLDAFTARCEPQFEGPAPWPPLAVAMRKAIRDVRRKIVERCENYKYTRRDVLNKHIGKGNWRPIDHGMIEWHQGTNNADPGMDLRGVSLVLPTPPSQWHNPSGQAVLISSSDVSRSGGAGTGSPAPPPMPASPLRPTQLRQVRGMPAPRPTSAFYIKEEGADSVREGTSAATGTPSTASPVPGFAPSRANSATDTPASD